MSPQRRNSTRASAWLVEGMKPRPLPETEESPTAADEASADVAVPAAVEKPAVRDSDWLPVGGEPSLEEETGEAEALRERVAKLQAELRKESKRADSEVKRRLGERESEFEKREAKLKETVDRLKAELADAKTKTSKPRAPSRRTAKSGAKRARTTTKAAAKSTGATGKRGFRRGAKTSRRGRRSRSSGKLDLNEATFEELRGLGLSVTLSARMIAYRDVRGGFKDLDELNEIPGLSEKARKELKGKVHLGG